MRKPHEEAVIGAWHALWGLNALSCRYEERYDALAKRAGHVGRSDASDRHSSEQAPCGRRAWVYI